MTVAGEHRVVRRRAPETVGVGASLGHPEIDNGTPFAFEPLFIADEELRPVVVTVVKATYSFDLHGAVWLADEQIPVNLAR